MIDFHCHLTTNEVCGYLGGTWDFNTHNLIITDTFPLLNTRFDRAKAVDCEYNIQKTMLEKNIQLVGWYHSHPRFDAQPTMRDCDKQMDYQIKLRGTSDTTYTPCVGFIFSSYDGEDVENEAKMLPFWVLPPPENRPSELARPMIMSYTTQQDEKLPDGIKEQMTACVNYYKQFQYELLDFAEMKMNDDVMALEKMKNSLFLKFPMEDQKSGALWNWIRELLGLSQEDPVVIPKKILNNHRQLEEERILKEQKLKEQEIEKKLKEEREQEAAKQALNAISCLQQQLSQPSGLNMTPSPISSAIVTNSSSNNKQSSSSTTTNTSSSPRDSPATIPSTATSPAKFEIPVRASPSPAKSDTSSVRARNSPAPSPAKLPERPPRNSSSVSSASSSKYDVGYGASNFNDLYAATLASFAKNLPPGLLPAEYSSLLQNSKLPDFGMSALGSLQASAAALSASNNFPPSAGTSGSGSKKNTSQQSAQSYSNAKPSTSSSAVSAAAAAANSNSWLSQIPNMKEFMSQLEKSDLSVLMQSPYNIPTCKPSSKTPASGSSSARTDYHHNQESVLGSNRENQNQGSVKRKGRPPNNPVSYDYDGYKAEAGKIADLMKSPEYTQMLMNQANAFRGLGTEITVTRKPSSSNTSTASSKKSSNASNQNQQSNSGNSSASASLLQHLPVMDLNYLAEISKSVPELNALLNSNKPEDINALLQMQMMAKNMDYASALFGTGGKGGSSAAATSKAMQDYAAAAASSNMLSQYMSNASNLSSIFGPMYGAMSGGSMTERQQQQQQQQQQYSSGSGSRKRDNSNRGSSSTSSKQQAALSQSNVSVAPNAADMLNSLFASATKGSSGSSAMTNLMSSADLSAYFQSPSSSISTPTTSTKLNNSTSGGGITSAMDYSSLFSHMSPAKLQEMSSLFSQSKYSIPDPLAKSTLAANNAYLSPSLMKLQQEALNTRLMKPPKSSSSSSSSKIDTPPPLMGMASVSPMSEKRSTPTKSLRDSPAMLPKYNFSAADLAISSHLQQSTTPTDFSRKSTPTPPVDLVKDRPVPPKKRMEFSSIAELVAPSPSKRQKYDDDESDEPAVLNLSNN